MRQLAFALVIATATTLAGSPHGSAQTVGDVFRTVNISVLTSDLADILNLPPKALGYLVKTVAAGSLGEAIGLRGGRKIATIDGERIVVGGDVILKVQGIAVNDFASYELIRNALIGLSPGATVTVTILRAGQVLDLTERVP